MSNLLAYPLILGISFSTLGESSTMGVSNRPYTMND